MSIDWVHNHRITNFVELLVPGYGFLMTLRDFVEIIDPIESMMPASPPCVREIELSKLQMNKHEIMGVYPLLKVAGPSLTRFSFEAKIESVLNDTLVNAAIEDCPVLQSLSLISTRISSMHVIVDAFEKYHRSWETLDLQDVDIDDGDDIGVFTDALSDPNSGITRNLRHINLDLDSLSKEALMQLYEMLGVNKTIRYIRVGVRSDVADKMIPEFKKPNDDTHKMPIGIKVAFLSCLPSMNFQPTARDALDSYILARIFDFASDPARRTGRTVRTKRQ